MGAGSSVEGHPEYGFLTQVGKQTIFDEQRRQSLEERTDKKYIEQMQVKELLLKSQKKHRDTVRKEDDKNKGKDQHLHRKLSKLHTPHETEDKFATALLDSARNASLIALQEKKQPTEHRRLSKLHDIQDKPDLFANALAASARRASVSVTGHDITKEKPRRTIEQEDAKKGSAPETKEKPTVQSKTSTKHRRLSQLHRDQDTKADEDLFASAVAASARRASLSVAGQDIIREKPRRTIKQEDAKKASAPETKQNPAVQSKISTKHRRLSQLHRDQDSKADEDLFASAVAASARRASLSVAGQDIMHDPSLQPHNEKTGTMSKKSNKSKKEDANKHKKEDATLTQRQLSDKKNSKTSVTSDGKSSKPHRRLSRLHDVQSKPDEDLFAKAVTASARRASLSVVEEQDVTGLRDHLNPLSSLAEQSNGDTQSLSKHVEQPTALADHEYTQSSGTKSTLSAQVQHERKASFEKYLNFCNLLTTLDNEAKNVSPRGDPPITYEQFVEIVNKRASPVIRHATQKNVAYALANQGTDTKANEAAIEEAEPQHLLLALCAVEAYLGVTPNSLVIQPTEVVQLLDIEYPDCSTSKQEITMETDAPSETNADVPSETTVEVPPEATIGVPHEADAAVPQETTTDVPSETTLDVPPTIGVHPEADVAVQQDSTENVPTEVTADIPSKPTIDVPSKPTIDVPPEATIDVPPEADINVPLETTTDVPSETTTVVPPEANIDVPNETNTDVPLETTSDIPSETTIDVPSKPAIDIPQEATIDDLPETIADVPPEANVDVPLATTIDISPEATTDIPSDTTIDVSSKPPIDCPPDITADVPSETTIDLPTETPIDVPPETTIDVPPEIAIDVTSQAAIDVPPETNVDVQPEAAVDVPSKPPIDIPPEETIDVPPEETIIDVPPEAAINVTSETTIDVSPKAAADVLFEAIKDVPPQSPIDVPPESTINVQPETTTDVPPETIADVPDEAIANIPSDTVAEVLTLQSAQTSPLNVSETVSKPEYSEAKDAPSAPTEEPAVVTEDAPCIADESAPTKEPLIVTEDAPCNADESAPTEEPATVSEDAPCTADESAPTKEPLIVTEDAPCTADESAPAEEPTTVTEDAPCAADESAPTEEPAIVTGDALCIADESAPTEDPENVTEDVPRTADESAPAKEDDYLEDLFISDIMSSETDATILGLPDLPTTNVSDWDVPKLQDLDLPKPSTLAKTQQSSPVKLGSTEDASSTGSNSTLPPPPPPSTPQNTPSNFFKSGIDDAIQAVLGGTSERGGQVKTEPGGNSSEAIQAVLGGASEGGGRVKTEQGIDPLEAAVKPIDSCDGNDTAGKVEIQENDYLLTDSQINCLVDAYAPGANLSQKSIRSVRTASICAGMVVHEPEPSTPKRSKTDNTATENADTNSSSLLVPNMDSSNNGKQ